MKAGASGSTCSVQAGEPTGPCPDDGSAFFVDWDAAKAGVGTWFDGDRLTVCIHTKALGQQAESGVVPGPGFAKVTTSMTASLA